MTVEEYKSVSKECGFNYVVDGNFIFIVLGNETYCFSYYNLKINVIKIARNVLIDDENTIIPTDGNDMYSVDLDKEYYRNRMLNLQKEIKKHKIELKLNELEQDFENV